MPKKGLYWPKKDHFDPKKRPKWPKSYLFQIYRLKFLSEFKQKNQSNQKHMPQETSILNTKNIISVHPKNEQEAKIVFSIKLIFLQSLTKFKQKRTNK